MDEKKRVGILTMHRSNNYGAMLQAYALSKFLQKIGYDSFFVDYRIESIPISAYLRQPLAFLLKVAGKKAMSLNFIKAKVAEKSGKRLENEFAKLFEDFRNEHLSITNEIYNYERLKAECPKAHAFVVGSDQVWSDDFVFGSPAFLLGFVPKGTKRISYAASFGKGRLEAYLKPVFKRYISKFDFVSVREKSGIELVKGLSGFEPEHVIDPTLLLTSYDEIIDYSLVPDEDYIFTYRLGQDFEMANWMEENIKAISSSMALPVYSVTTNSAEGFVKFGQPLQPTPGQLIGLIAKSKFFVTNSFHGTVFAILFRTDFLTFARDSSPDKQNLRLTELLATAGLCSCYCEPGLNVSEVLKKTQIPFNFNQAHERLRSLRDTSSYFLENALK